MTTEVKDYNDVAEETLSAIRENVRQEAIDKMIQNGSTETQAEKLVEQDVAVQMVIEADALDRALQSVGQGYRDLSRMGLEVIYRMAEGEYYHHISTGERIESLQDWAYQRLAPFDVSEDYIRKMVNSVERMLIPVTLGGFTVDGEEVNGLDMIRTCDMAQLVHRTYAFSVGNRSDQEALVSGMIQKIASNRLKALHTDIVQRYTATLQQTPVSASPRIQALLGLTDDTAEQPEKGDFSYEKSADGTVTATPSKSVFEKPVLLLADVEGGWQLSSEKPLTEYQMNLLQMLIADRFELKFAVVQHVQ